MTTLRYIFTFTLLACVTFLTAQTPGQIQLHSGAQSSERACPDRNAGTVRLGNFNGQSNDIALNRSFFCLNDRLNIVHNADAEVLDSDPNASTPPGVGYAWYTCPPTVDRASLDDIFTDPCLLTDPQPTSGIYVYVDQINGNALFQNGSQISGQTIPDFFNNGEPIEIWFAPITIDAVANGEAVFEGTPPGTCVHANVDAAFSIVYLTPIASANRRVISDGSGGCLGSFELFGGLPQFDGSDYDITIEHVDMAGVFGTLQGSNYSHGDQVTFSFTEPGRYRVTVEDGKSCLQEFEMSVVCTNPVTFNIESVSADAGQTVCLGVTVEGFTNMGVISFDFSWDPNVFEYVSNSGFMIPTSGLDPVDLRVDQGRLGILWVAPGFTGHTEPDGTTFFEICLRAVGTCGESTVLTLVGDIIVNDFDNMDLTYIVNDGVAQVNIGGAEATADVCPDDGTGTGSIKLNMCGGAAPYGVNYVGPNGGGSGSINEPNGMQLIEGLPAGDYTFTITDDNGVVLNRMVTVPSGMVPELTVGVDHPTCSYSSDGKIGVGVMPAGMYEIEWSTAEFNTDTIRNIGNGPYRVTVTDANGCSVTQSVTANTEPLVITGTVQDATCITSSNGRITANASGGTPFSNNRYRFQWQGFPPVTVQSSTLPNLSRGDYTVTVSDSNGCFTTETFTVNADREIVIDDVMITEPICYGDSTAEIRVQVSTLNASNDAGYIFDWRYNSMSANGAFISSTDFSVNNIPIPGGRYDVTITDFDEGLDCILDTFFVIDQPPPIEVELVSFRDETCNPGNDGRLVIRATGGRATGPSDYLYNWDTSVDPSLNNFVASQDGLSANVFPVMVFDLGDLQCSVDTFFELTQEEGPEILQIDVTNVSCGGVMDGELEIFYIRPGGQTFEVDWEDEFGNTYMGDEITGLAAGTYFVTVTASAGCFSIDTAVVGNAADIVLDTVLYRTPTCPTSGNGAITVVASGPGSTLSYQWNHPNGSNSPVLPSVPAGTYSVTISAVGSTCPPLIIDTLTLRPPSIFDVNFTGVAGATCPGICDGTATANATGGMGTINYLWSTGQTVATATDLCAGTNFVVISDDLCSDTFFVDIPASESIQLEAVVGEITCFGDTDGFIRLTPTGMNPPFQFSWNDNGPMVADRTGLGAGLYISTVSDAMGCERVDTFVLTEPEELVVGVAQGGFFPITCAGRNDGRIELSVTGGNGGESYVWTPNVSQSNTAQNLAPGNYSVVVTDANGCTDDTSFILTEPMPIEFELGEQSTIACFGETAPFTVDTAYSGAGGPYTYAVNNGPSMPIGEVINLLGGQYVVSIIDSSGCFIDTLITINQPAQFSIDIGEDITLALGDSARLGLVSFSGSFPIDSFIWSSTGDDLSCTLCPSPSISPVMDETVVLIAVDSSGCRASDELLVFVDARRKVYIPNAFSPNDDGINDEFQVFAGVGVARIASMRVFNRWGQQVFQAENLPASAEGSTGWDGTANGKELNPDVFAFVIQVEFVDNQVLTYSGEVTLIK